MEVTTERLFPLLQYKFSLEPLRCSNSKRDGLEKVGSFLYRGIYKTKGLAFSHLLFQLKQFFVSR
jgi:hypothetical protein